MSDSWPGKWHSKADSSGTDTSGDSLTNDNSILCLTGDGAEEYLFFGGVPPNMENHA